VLKAVVGDHDIEAMGFKRKICCISLDKYRTFKGLAFQVKPYNNKMPANRIEATFLARAEIKNNRTLG
jgi:hypothetical protein